MCARFDAVAIATKLLSLATKAKMSLESFVLFFMAILLFHSCAIFTARIVCASSAKFCSIVVVDVIVVVIVWHFYVDILSLNSFSSVPCFYVRSFVCVCV